jgi:hypothetical protein
VLLLAAPTLLRQSRGFHEFDDNMQTWWGEQNEYTGCNLLDSG